MVHMGTVKQPLDVQPDLYERDFYEWANYMGERLKARDVKALDWDNLAEEIEGLARSDRRELFSRIEVLIMHLLKWRVQRGLRCGSWSGTIVEQRSQIETLLNDSPSLRKQVTVAVQDKYPAAKRKAINEMDLLQDPFPDQCPFTPEQVLDYDFLPE